ncbi:MAG: hypothetical protein H0X25_20595 [Acidobacteriales bacterium]|nr:hypothetical protein [Terriglobales bacterium]
MQAVLTSRPQSPYLQPFGEGTQYYHCAGASAQIHGMFAQLLQGSWYSTSSGQRLCTQHKEAGIADMAATHSDGASLSVLLETGSGFGKEAGM